MFNLNYRKKNSQLDKVMYEVKMRESRTTTI